MPQSLRTARKKGVNRRVGDTALSTSVLNPIDHRRQLVADLCRMLGPNQITKKAPQTPIAQELPKFSPRMKQTLERLLVGDSEKQIANHLGVSKHTIHVYVKALYKGFNVCSRGELLAKFVRPSALGQGNAG